MIHKPTRSSFTRRLLGLVCEPAFIKFINLQTEINIFRIVGRAHYERWHSAFWGWLLDAHGSHLLGDYVLTRFLYLLFDEKCLVAINPLSHDLLRLLPTIQFTNIEVTPNENLPIEVSVKDVGRLDIFLTCQYQDTRNNQGRLNVIFELKIDSPARPLQASKYADWIQHNHATDVNLLIYMVPRLRTNSLTTVGDERWYCLDYQILHDKLLLPVLEHPNLNDKARPFVVQYLKNLKFRYRGIKMAITDEEKRLALDLYEKYADVFDAIYDALASEGVIDYSIPEVPKGRTTGRLAVSIDGQMFVNDTLRELLKIVLVYIVDKGYVMRVPLPWGSSPRRFILTNQNPPVHPNGKAFFYPEHYKGYTIETHYARERGLKVLNDLCNKLELDFEMIEA